MTPSVDPAVLVEHVRRDVTSPPSLLEVAVGGDQRRILSGPDLRVSLVPMTLVEQDGTVLGRWRVVHQPS